MKLEAVASAVCARPVTAPSEGVLPCPSSFAPLAGASALVLTCSPPRRLTRRASDTRTIQGRTCRVYTPSKPLPNRP